MGAVPRGPAQHGLRAVLEAQADGAAAGTGSFRSAPTGSGPKVPNRTVLGPTAGDKAHSPFGAY